MSRDLGRDVPNVEKLYAGKHWADFSFPILWGAINESRVIGSNPWTPTTSALAKPACARYPLQTLSEWVRFQKLS